MNIKNIKLRVSFAGYERWDYELDGVQYVYTTMDKDWKVDAFAAICYAQDVYTSKRIAVIHQYLSLGTNPEKNLKRFYKLILLQ